MEDARTAKEAAAAANKVLGSKRDSATICEYEEGQFSCLFLVIVVLDKKTCGNLTQFVIRDYEEGVQIQILIPPLPPWVKSCGSFLVRELFKGLNI